MPNSFRFAASIHHQLEPGLQHIQIWSAMAIPSFRVVGLPGPEIIESCERVRAAICSSGFEFPKRRVLVNLSPAGIRKQGTGTDLAIALAVLSSSEPREDRESTERLIVASGELGLDGSVSSAGRVTRTCLAACRAAAFQVIFAIEDQAAAREAMELIRESGEVFQSSPLPSLHFVGSLAEALEAATLGLHAFTERSNGPLLLPSNPVELAPPPELLTPGAELFRSILACSTGGHSLLLLGPKGAGKTASLRWLPYLAGKMSADDRLLRRIASEIRSDHTSTEERDAIPLREISPQVRAESLVGSVLRNEIRPGELTLAHGGILVADEFLEWRRDAREALRDPLESGRVLLNRAQGSVTLPARFMFAATANLCPCGGWPTEVPLPRGMTEAPRCRCSPKLRHTYLERLSGPILDRIDCVRWVRASPVRPSGEPVRDQVELARQRLLSHWGELPGRWSAAQTEERILAHPGLSEGQADWGSEGASLRRRHREIRLACTLAALDGLALPEPRHFVEARPASLEPLRGAAHSTVIIPKPVSGVTPSSADLTVFGPHP